MLAMFVQVDLNLIYCVIIIVKTSLSTLLVVFLFCKVKNSFRVISTRFYKDS